MRSSQMDNLRAVVQGLSQNGAMELNNALVYRALGVESDAERAVIRRQLNEMCSRHELERIRPGNYRYNAKARPGRSGLSYQRMWRAIRASKTTFVYADIAATAHVETSFVNKYCLFLLESDFIRRNGKDGTRLLYSITTRGRETRDTPYPPIRISLPFEAERKAMSRLARIFFEEDLYTSKTKAKIVKECQAILARFDVDCTQDENGGKDGRDGQKNG